METTGNSGNKLWRPSWKGVLITLLVGSNIILIRIIGALLYKSMGNEISHCKQLRMNNNQSYTDSNPHPEDGKISLMEIKTLLCVNKSGELAGCTLCPNGWLQHREICYYISSGGEYRTWKESREVCEEMGAHLLVIEDPEQREFINRSSKGQAGKAMFWMGLYRDGDGWRWVDGRHCDISLFRLLGEFPGNCVQMHAVAGFYKDDCKSLHKWICQRRALKI